MNEQQREKVRQSLKRFLDPDSLRSNLGACSLFLVAWESFSNAVIDYLRGFYSLGVDPGRDENSPEYQSEVLDRHKYQLTASLLWFREKGAINDDDLALADQCRIHRNEIAHELPKYLTTVDYNVDTELLGALVELNAKVGRWWVLEIEVPINPDFDNQDIAAEDVQSGNMWFLNHLLCMAMGDVEKVDALHEWFKEMDTAIAHAGSAEPDNQ